MQIGDESSIVKGRLERQQRGKMSNCKIAAIIGFFISLSGFVSGSNCQRNSNSRHLLCYYEGEIELRKFNVGHCTHLIFTKSVDTNDGLRITEEAKSDSSWVKETNEGLSTVFTLEMKETEFAGILKSEEKIENFAARITAILRQSRFDGIEIDFRFDSDADDLSKESISSFTRILSKSLNSQRRRRIKSEYLLGEAKENGNRTKEIEVDGSVGKIQGRTGNSKGEEPEAKTDDEDCNKYLLIVRLPNAPNVIGKKYDLKALSRHADILSVSTHNISSENDNGLTYHQSRLMGLSDVFNTDSILDFLLGMGATKSKIVVTLPAFALKFRLRDPERNTPGSPSLSGPEIIDQSQLCSMLREKKNWTLERDEDMTAPYAFSGNLWLAFEDEISVDIKGKYIIVREIAGGAIYPIDSDANDETCTKRKGTAGYLTRILHRTFRNLARKPRGLVLKSLQREIHDASYSGIEAGVKLSEYRIVRVVDHSGAVHVIRRNAKTEFECSRQGYFSHPLGCNKFYRCVKFDQHSDDFTVFEYDCPVGLAFDERWEVCVWPGSLPDGAPCKGSSEIAPVPRSHYHCPKKEGYYADPENCRWFFACLDHRRDGVTPLTAYEFRCPFGLVFNEAKMACDWPWKVGSCGNRGGSSLSFGGQTGTETNEAYSDSSIDGHGGNANGGQTANFINPAAEFVRFSVEGKQKSLDQNDQRGAVGYIPSQLDGGNNNRAPFATFPDYEISGGRSRNNEGVVLQENVNFGRVSEGFRGGTKFGSTSVSGSDFGRQQSVKVTGDSDHGVYNGHGTDFQKLQLPTAPRPEEDSSNAGKYLISNGLPTSKPIVQFTRFTQLDNTQVSGYSAIGSTTHGPMTEGSPQTVSPNDYSTENNGKRFEFQYANNANNQNSGYFGGKHIFTPNVYQNGDGVDVLSGRQQNFFVAPSNVVIGAPVAVSRPKLHSYPTSGKGASTVKLSHGNPAITFNVPILTRLPQVSPVENGDLGDYGISGEGFHGRTTIVPAGFSDPTKIPFVQNLANVVSNVLNVDGSRTGLNFQSTSSPVRDEGYSGRAQEFGVNSEQNFFETATPRGRGKGKNLAIEETEMPTAIPSPGPNLQNAVELTNFGGGGAGGGGQAFESPNPSVVENLKNFQNNANFDQGNGNFHQQEIYANPTGVEPHSSSVATALSVSDHFESGAAGFDISTPSAMTFDQSRKEHGSRENGFDVLRENPSRGSAIGNQNYGNALRFENGIKFGRPETFRDVPNVEFESNLNQGGITQGFVKTENGDFIARAILSHANGPRFYNSHSTIEQEGRRLNPFRPSGLQNLEDVNRTFQKIKFHSNAETAKYATGLGNRPQGVINIGSTASTPIFESTGKATLSNYFSDASDFANHGSGIVSSHRQQQTPSTSGSLASISVTTSTPVTTYENVLSTIYATQRPNEQLLTETPRPVFYSQQLDGGPTETSIFTPTAASIPSTQQTFTTIRQPSTVSGKGNVHPVSFGSNVNEGKYFTSPESQVTLSNVFHGQQEQVVPVNAFGSVFLQQGNAFESRPKNVFITGSREPESQMFAPNRETLPNDGSEIVRFQQETLPPSLPILDSQAFVGEGQNFNQSPVREQVAIGAQGFDESAKVHREHGNVVLHHAVEPTEFNSSRYLHPKEFLFQTLVQTSAEQPNVPHRHSFTKTFRNPIFVPFYNAQNSGNFISEIRQQKQQSSNGRARFGEGNGKFYGKGELPKSRPPLITTAIEQPEGILSQVPVEINSVKFNLLQPVTAAKDSSSSSYAEDSATQRYNQIEYESVTRPEAEGPWRPNIFLQKNFTFVPKPTGINPVPGFIGKLAAYDGTQNLATGSAFALFDTDSKGGINPNIKISPPSKEYILLHQNVHPANIGSPTTEVNTPGFHFKSEPEGLQEGHSRQEVTLNPNIKIAPPSKEYLLGRDTYTQSPLSVTTEVNTAGFHFKSQGSDFDALTGKFVGISPDGKYANGLDEATAEGNGGTNAEYRGTTQTHFHSDSDGSGQLENNEKFRVTVINGNGNGQTNDVTQGPPSFRHGTGQGSGGRHYHGGIISETPAANKYEGYEADKVGGGFSKGATNLQDAGARENDQKVIVVSRVSDSDPVLVGKLAGQCSCQSNPINLIKGNGETSNGVKLKIKKIQNTDRGAFSAGQKGQEDFTVVGSAGATEATNPAGTGTASTTAHRVDGVVTITPKPHRPDPTNKKNHSRGKARYLPPSSPFGDNYSGSDFLFSPALTSKIVKTFGHAALGGQESRTHDAIGGKTSKAHVGGAFDRYGPGGWRSYDETLQGSVDCKRPGLFRHPKYCNKFYACNYDVWEQKFTLHVFNCPVRLTYDDSIGACNWPVSGPACANDNLIV